MNIPRMYTLLLLLILAGGPLYAKLQGKARIDSLMAELPRQKEDTGKVLLLCSLSRAYSFSDPDEGIKYGQTALALAQKLNWPRGIARANSSIGTNYQNTSDYDKALEHYRIFLKINTEIGDKNGIAEGNRNIGNICFFRNDYSCALDYYLKALSLYEESGSPQDIASTNINIGAVYFSQSNYSRALEHYFKALKPSEESGNKNALAVVTGNIGNVYVRLEDYAKALEYYFKALAINKELGDRSGVASVTSNIGAIYHLQKNYAKALEHYTEALKLCVEIGYQKGVATNTKAIALEYAEQKNYVMALAAFEKAIKIAQEIGLKSEVASGLNGMGNVYLDIFNDPAAAPVSAAIPRGKPALLQKTIECQLRSLAIAKEINEPETIQPCYESLARAYKLKGDFKNALDAANNARIIQDSLFSKENNKKIAQQEMKYEFEKKEAVARVEQEKRNAIAAKELQKQKLVRNGFMGGFAVVLVFAGVFFSQRNKIKTGKKQSDELLLNILPAEVAEELKAKGAAEAKLIDEVTVLFTDIKDFTLLSQKLSPKELVAEINNCFSAFDRIMQKHHVEKIKTIGDAYMAAGGLPTPNNTHASDVVKAALEIQQYIAGYRKQKESAGQPGFELRIGIHTGPVVAGIVGIKKFAYDIWGDTVNTASRMESSGEAGKVNISGSTYELVKSEFNCEYRGKITAKGKGDIDMYFVR
jgi:adenylate cyclase